MNYSIYLFILEKQTWNKTKVVKEVRMQGQRLWGNDSERKNCENYIKKRMQIVASESKELIRLKEAEKMLRI